MMETLVAHPQNEAQEKALRAVMEALQVPYEIEPESIESPYNPEFVAAVLQSQEEIKAGNYSAYSMEEFKNLCK